ncbi:MAG: HisA/HisF-related TIM barrel protein [Gemmatimonadaceae bacterium]
MIVIPTIDLRHGLCVQPGPQPSDETLLLGNPIMVARSWAHAGFRWLHVVDADADGGTGSNAGMVEDVIRDSALDIQASGGVQCTDQIECLVDAGAALVVVGARGIEEPEWLASVAECFPGMIVVSTDVHERRVLTRGWVHSVPLDIFDLIGDLAGLPLGGLLLSAVGGNGHRSAMDLALIEDVVQACDFPVMTVGGVSAMPDLRALEHRGIVAAVIGSVLDNGHLDVRRVAEEFGA